MKNQGRTFRGPFVFALASSAFVVWGCGAPEAQVAQPTSVAPIAAAEEQAPTILGRWTGVGEQTPRTDQPVWTMHVEITSTGPGPCATVQYPDFPCQTEWICEPGFDGVTLRAVERVVVGAGVCADGGQMEMSLTPRGELQWRQVVPDQGIEAWATLVRPR